MYGHPHEPAHHPGHPGQRRWICRICGFVYDEAIGDADHGLATGTLWEQVPEDWSCPICRVRKADFDPLLDE